MTGQFIQLDHIALAVFIVMQKIRQRQLFGDDIKLQIILTRHRLTAGTINGCTDTNNGGKRFTTFTGGTIGTNGRMKNRSQITYGTVRAGIAAVVTTQHIRRQGTDVFTTATLGRFVLTRVVMKQRIVGGGHNGLNRIGCGGFTGAVTAGE